MLDHCEWTRTASMQISPNETHFYPLTTIFFAPELHVYSPLQHFDPQKLDMIFHFTTPATKLTRAKEFASQVQYSAFQKPVTAIYFSEVELSPN